MIKNQDLWRLLLRVVRRLFQYGIQVLLWRIPRNFNRDADRAAREAAGEDAVEEFTVPLGVMRGPGEMGVIFGPWEDHVKRNPHLSTPDRETVLLVYVGGITAEPF